MSEIEELKELSHKNSFKLGFLLEISCDGYGCYYINNDEKEITLPEEGNALMRWASIMWNAECLNDENEDSYRRCIIEYKIYNDNYRFFELFFSNSIPPKVRYEVYTSLIEEYNKHYNNTIKPYLKQKLLANKSLLKDIKHRNVDKETEDKIIKDLHQRWYEELKSL